MQDFKNYETVEEVLADNPTTTPALLSATAFLLRTLTDADLTPQERNDVQAYYDMLLDRLRAKALEHHLYEKRFPGFMLLRRVGAVVLLAVMFFLIRRFTELEESLIDALWTSLKAALAGGLLLGGLKLAQYLWTRPADKID